MNKNAPAVIARDILPAAALMKSIGVEQLTMRKLLLGNEAIARGLYEAGCVLVSSYPGTPSTEITEYAAMYDEMHCEWAPNEKVGVEVAFGASLGGGRAFSAMKHVGLNVAADPLFTASYTGVNAGLVIGVADDPGMHSSQNEQDSRNYARAAKVPMLEPASSQECLTYTKQAFKLSEEYDTPVMLRLTTRIAHSRTLCTVGQRETPPEKPFQRNIAKYVMAPANAKHKHPVVEARTRSLEQLADTSELNQVEYNDTKIGIITSGAAYQYAREVMGTSASYLKLGLVYPLPRKLLLDFAQKVDTLYVLEELDDFIESHCRGLGLDVIGKDLFSRCGELTQEIVREKLLGRKPEFVKIDQPLPGRPPVMCAGCPHRGLFYALKRQKDIFVSGDIGCYTLAATPPLSSMDTCLCMGASVGGAHGFQKAAGKKSVAVLGDSTFLHSGVTGLINVAYNQGNTLTIILDNSITGMTGHQQNPATGKNIKGQPAPAVDLEALVRAVGISRVRVVDPYDLKHTAAAVEEELRAEEASVIITRRPCALLKHVRHAPPLSIDSDVCTGCKACMGIGCPAISLQGRQAVIDRNQCVGCGQCKTLCQFGAMKRRD